MTPPALSPFRLSFRVEGDWWVVYLAKINTMNDARELGRILMSIVTEHKDCKEAFMSVMKIAIEHLTNGAIENWNEPILAPEHERAGRA